MMYKGFVLLISIFMFSGETGAQLWKQQVDTASMFVQERKWDSAALYYERAKKSYPADSLRSLDYALVCDSLGYMYGNLYVNSKAVPNYKKSMQIKESLYGKSYLGYGLTSIYLGDAYTSLRRVKEAEPYLIEGKDIIEKAKGKECEEYVTACSFLGYLYYELGQYERTAPLYREALAIMENLKGKEHEETGDSRNELAVVYSDMGLFDQAEQLYIKNLEIGGRTAIGCDNLGVLYFEMGDFNNAELLFLEAKELRAKYKGKQHPDYGRSCRNLGILYNEIGQYKKSELSYLEAKQVIELKLGKRHAEYLLTANNLAGLYMDMGDLVKAESFFLENLTIMATKPRGKEDDDYRMACTSLGNLYHKQKRYEKADSFLMVASSLAQTLYGMESQKYAELCNNRGVLYMEMGLHVKAATLLLEAKAVFENLFGKDHPKYENNSFSLATLYWLMNDIPAATRQYRESFLTSLNQINKVFLFTSEDEKQNYINKAARNTGKYMSFYFARRSGNGGDPFAVSILSRNLILTSSHLTKKIVYESDDSAMIRKMDLLVELKKQLAFWYAKPVNERAGYLPALEAKSDSTEKELVRMSAVYSNYQTKKNVTWQDIRGRLDTNSAVVEFSAFQYFNGQRWTDSIYYVAFLLSRQLAEPEMIYLFEQRQMDLLLRSKSTSAGQLQLNQLYTSSKTLGNPGTLYNLIWKPLENKLEGIKTVYFAPAGSLHKISLAGLPTGNNLVLSDKYKLMQLNTTASVIENKEYVLAGTDKISVFGGIQYDADSVSITKTANKKYAYDVASRSLTEDLSRDGVPEFRYLAGTEKEALAIKGIGQSQKIEIKSLSGLEATEESFKSLSGNYSPAVLHIATHGFFFPDPKNIIKDDKTGGATVFRQSDNPLIRSGLAMAGANNAWKGKPVMGVEDGILTSYEVSSMYLPNTKLAVLSACETGLGDIQGSEGVYGLQRAFKMAGVENLVMSLWKVPDTETAEFMQEFYKNLFAKQAISDAFYNAQTVMKNRYRKEPYKWAAWVLIR